MDFVYRLGHTTLDEARAYWSQNGMKIVGAGHLAVGGGSAMDRAGKVSAEKVLLVDVFTTSHDQVINPAPYGLTNVTDNRVGGAIVPPPGVVRHDSDDPYLVVAADKIHGGCGP